MVGTTKNKCKLYTRTTVNQALMQFYIGVRRIGAKLNYYDLRLVVSIIIMYCQWSVNNEKSLSKTINVHFLH